MYLYELWPRGPIVRTLLKPLSYLACARGIFFPAAEARFSAAFFLA